MYDVSVLVSPYSALDAHQTMLLGVHEDPLLVVLILERTGLHSQSVAIAKRHHRKEMCR